ncbi:MAG: Fic family protein [Nitriliruptor sp.]|nr:MAG: Fic family protein [Nitriliruptor sp.]
MRFKRGRYVTQRRPVDLGAFGGRAAKAGLSYEAFVPASIADIDVRLSGVAAADVADAEAALARLAHGSAAFPSLEALARRLLRSEAIASSWIEALHVSHRRLAEAEQGAPGGRYDEARRVLGNVRALDAAVDIGARSDPLSVDDLLSMHGALLSTSNVEDDRARAGEVRDGPVFIGGTSPTNAEYVGPPHEEVVRLLEDLVVFVNTRGDLSPVVVAGLAHAQFESIHPHHDGNGRVGRCLVHTLLRRETASTVLPPLSIAFARPEARYVEGLNAFRNDDLDGWLTVFATAISFAAHATIGLAREVGTIQQSWLAQLAEDRARSGLRPPRADAAVLAACNILPDMPAFHARDLAQRLDRSWRAAQDAIAELADVGIVKQLSAGKGNRLYEVPEIFALLDGFEHDPERLVAIGSAR